MELLEDLSLNNTSLESESNSVKIVDINSEQKTDVPKRKHRRGKQKGGLRHHRANRKPYSKMTWDERKIMDELETKRANKKREKLFNAGQPMAPYNTTQFLMEYHEADELAGGQNGTKQVCFPDDSASSDSSDGEESSNEDFLDKEFEEIYDNCHAERLQSLTKDELIRDYIYLETKLNSMEKLLKDRGIDLPHVEKTWTASESFENDKISYISLFCGSPESDLSPSLTKRLKAENEILKKELTKIRCQFGIKKVDVNLAS